MPQSLNSWNNVSLLVFGLKIKPLDVKFYNQLREHIHNHEHLKHVISVIQELPHILADLANDVESVSHWLSNTKYVNDLVEWISGRDNEIAESISGSVVLPLLALIHLTQYLSFLSQHHVDHDTFVSHIRRSGEIQGFCGGLPSGLAVASAGSESDLIHNAAVSIRLAFIIGIIGEAADDPTNRFGMLVIRLAYPGQGDALMELFPEIAIAAVTDPRSVTVSGSLRDLSSLEAYARRKGMHVQQWPLRGKWHHPQNLTAAQQLSQWCSDQPRFTYKSTPRAGDYPRSNYTTDCIAGDQFTNELIFGVLARRSDWYKVLKKVARQAQTTEVSPYHIINFGVGDCIPLTAFNELNMSVEKVNAHALLCDVLQRERACFPIDELPYSDLMVAIVGASCRLPGANDLAELWTLLAKADDQHQTLDNSRFNISESHRHQSTGAHKKGKQYFANLLNDVASFDNAFFAISPKEAANMDPQQRIVLELAYEAMESCGYTKSHKRERGDNVGCFIGAGAVDYHENTSSYAPCACTSTGTARSFISGRVSHHFGWTGPSEVIDTACSSSLVAIHRACRALENGECVMALAGGVNVMTSPNRFFDLAKAGFLSPTGQCKPFDRAADGYCRADGAGLVALKLLGQARSDNDPILAVIPGSYVNQSGPSSSVTVPHLHTQVDLLRQAARKAAVDAASISYVEAHGIGTQIGDSIEMNSLRQFFTSMQRSDVVHVASIKGNIGHSEAAAGVSGLLKVIVMLQHGKIPLQPNFHVLNSKISDLVLDGMAVPTKPLKWQARHRIALVNGYGTSGANAAVVVRSGPKKQALQTSLPLAKTCYNQPIMLSAATKSSVKAYAQVLSNYLSQTHEQFSIQDIAFTLNSRRKAFEHRIIVNAKDAESLRSKLMTQTYDLCHVSSQQYPVVLTLSGRSHKIVGLSKVIYDRYPRFKDHLDECNRILIESGYPSIIPAMFSPDDIENPVILETSLVASQIAFSFCWLESGIRVSAVLGHSLGELTALAVTGVLSIRDCLNLVAYRAKLIETKWDIDKGAMLSVSSTPSGIEQLVSEIRAGELGDIEIACFNSATNVVLTGPLMAIQRAEKSLKYRDGAERLRTHRLKVNYAFHSRLISPILNDLSAYAISLEWKQPKIHLETCSEGGNNARYFQTPAEHARRPVFFEKAVRRLESKLGPCAWLEAGMNTQIMSLTRKATLRTYDHQFFSVSVDPSNEDTDVISGTVRSLWREGINSDSWAHLEFPVCKQIWLPPYQFDKHYHWLPHVNMAPIGLDQYRNSTGVKDPSFPKKMVSLVERTISTNPASFLVDTDSERFKQILDGHKVGKSTMAPAALFLECVAMAVFLLDTTIPTGGIQFSEVRFHSPLYSGAKRIVSLLLEQEDKATKEIKFVVRSREGSASTTRDLLHIAGKVVPNRDVDFDVFERLLSHKGPFGDNDGTQDSLRSPRAYKLLESAVRYASFFKGIDAISLGARQATATVRLPSSQPGIDNSDARQTSDAVAIDIFIQPLVLLVNSSDLVRDDEVMILSGIDRICFLPSFELCSSVFLTVVAKFSTSDKTETIGDIMVYLSEGSLVGMIIGCRFSRAMTPSIGQLNGPETSRWDTETSQELDGLYNTRSLPTSTDEIYQSIPEKTRTPEGEMDINFENLPTTLQPLLAKFTEPSTSAIIDNTNLSDLGLDSLTILELVAELDRKYGMDVSPFTLLDHSLKSLLLAIQESPAPLTQEDKLQMANSADENSVILHNILAECGGSTPQYIKSSMTLDEIGIDSLLSMMVQQEISERLSVNVSIHPSNTVSDVTAAIRERFHAQQSSEFPSTARVLMIKETGEES